MAKSLFIAPTSLDSGLTSVCLGLLRALEREGVSVGFYKPFSQSVHRGEARHNEGKDSLVEFVRSRSHVQTPDPLPLKQAQQLRSEEHTSELQSRPHLVCRLLLEKKKQNRMSI